MRPAFNVKDLWIRRTTFDKVLRDKASNIAKSPKYIGYQLGIASVVYNIFGKNSLGAAIKSTILRHQQLAEELHKTIIRKFER